jgi:hypothetical protein
MAKGQKRSNRELKKPKQIKPKTPATAGIAATVQGKQDAAARGKKKY